MSAYHQAKLAELLEHVRTGFAEYDAGKLDAFELDAIIHQYKQASRELWKFCAVSGSACEFRARTLEIWRDEGVEQDWWAAGSRQRS